MKWVDIRDNLTKNITEKLKKTVYSEEIDNITKDSFFIDLISYEKNFVSQYIEKKNIEIDIRYYPKTFSKTANAEIYKAFEELDTMFEIEGRKILHIKDRFLTLNDVSIKIVDKVGHYMFSLSLYDEYGKPYDYELMKDLELKFIEGGSN